MFPSGESAKYIDCHPMAKEIIKKGRLPVYFSIEGSLNADAILSCGLPAISVPSVAMWHAKNLSDFLEPLSKVPELYIVCDSDWLTNPDVARFTRRARDWFANHGYLVRAMAPPIDQSLPKDGVQDFLGRGGNLEDLEEAALDPPDDGTARKIVEEHMMNRRQDAKERALELMDALLRMDSICFRLRDTKIPKMRRLRAAEDLREAGVISVTRQAENRWDDGTKRFAGKPAVWAWSQKLRQRPESPVETAPWRGASGNCARCQRYGGGHVGDHGHQW
jgi:hypothetical protein